MKSIRVSLAVAGVLMLSASTLSAQATRIACKDGSQPKIGHFTCWGHGGVVTAPVKSAKKAEHRAVKHAGKGKAATSAKSSAKKPAAARTKKKK